MKSQFFLFKLLPFIMGIGSFIFLSSCNKNNVEEDVPVSTDPIITDTGSPTGSPTSANIGPSGGSIVSSDGRLTVTIPAGALSSGTTVSIQPISNEGPLGLGTAYRLSPENITFSQPVKLTFHYDNSLLDGVPEDFLWIITQSPDKSWNALLKSIVDKNANTVTVFTNHFSDWSLGKFIELSLSPSSKTLKKGASLALQVSGFASNGNTADEELAPLSPINSADDVLAPLTPIPANESRLMEFRVKGWTLNGTAAPVSNSNGSLNASGWAATYKAPDKRPSVNPVAVSVSLESSDKTGKKSSYILTSNISIVDSDLYLLVKVDGVTYEYYQYGYNGAVPPDPNNISIANCGIDDNILSIAGTQVANGSNLVSGFALAVKSPFKGTLPLKCLQNDGQDDVSFTLGSQQSYYEMTRTIRTKVNGGNCDVDFECGNISVTFTDYENELMGRVAGYFSGVLYEDKPEFSDNCTNPVQHTVEGEFWLIRAN